MFAWFDAASAKQFGLQLADFYIARVKTTQDLKSQKFIEKKQRELLSKISRQIDAFKADNSLNVYKRAQALNAFKWKLRDAGFEQAYVDELSDWVTRQL